MGDMLWGGSQWPVDWGNSHIHAKNLCLYLCLSPALSEPPSAHFIQPIPTHPVEVEHPDHLGDLKNLPRSRTHLRRMEPGSLWGSGIGVVVRALLVLLKCR